MGKIGILVPGVEEINQPTAWNLARGVREDIGIFKKAGLKIAMGNANKNIKALADVIVNDCDNGGCSQAIYNYLLAEKELAL